MRAAVSPAPPEVSYPSDAPTVRGKLLLTFEEAGEVLGGLSAKTIGREVERGALKAAPVGPADAGRRIRLVTAASLIEYSRRSDR